MKANEIYREFLKLTDVQKASVIDKAERNGVDKDSIDGLKWLASLSSEVLRDKVISELYAEEAYRKLVA